MSYMIQSYQISNDLLNVNFMLHIFMPKIVLIIFVTGRIELRDAASGFPPLQYERYEISVFLRSAAVIAVS